MQEIVTDLVFSDNHRRFKVPASIVEQLRQFAQVEKSQPEAGGILLGRLLLNTTDVVVDEITTPQPTDQCSRFMFRRLGQGHQQILDDRWKQSGGTCNYLGEWHTHPEPEPRPSGRDTRSWRDQVKLSPPDRQELYFVIVGTMALSVWRANRNPFHYYQLQLISTIR